MEISFQIIQCEKNNHLKYVYDKIYTIGYFTGFTVPWDKNVEQMVVILDFRQKMEKNDNFHHACIQSNCKSRLANDQYT